MSVSSDKYSQATPLAIPLTDTSVARGLQIAVILALLIQCVVLLPAAPLAAAVSGFMLLITLGSLRRTEQATGVLYLSEEGWCLVDTKGISWFAQTQAVSMVTFACVVLLRRGYRSRWVVLTRGSCGTGPWRALRRAVTLYARPTGIKDRIRARLPRLGVVQREVKSPALAALQRAENHQFRNH